MNVNIQNAIAAILLCVLAVWVLKEAGILPL